ncbi:hypothetical protein AAVH_03480 [Aphelenchoides avenae]|nr:hypothetical protein AAVH_03480 [Aphelenchus avenae]
MSADALLAEADQLLQRMTECLQAQTQVNNQTTASVRDTLKKSEQQFNAAVESVNDVLEEAVKLLGQPTVRVADLTTIPGVLGKVVEVESTLKVLADEYMEQTATFETFKRNMKDSKHALQMMTDIDRMVASLYREIKPLDVYLAPPNRNAKRHGTYEANDLLSTALMELRTLKNCLKDMRNHEDKLMIKPAGEPTLDALLKQTVDLEESLLAEIDDRVAAGADVETIMEDDGLLSLKDAMEPPIGQSDICQHIGHNVSTAIEPQPSRELRTVLSALGTFSSQLNALSPFGGTDDDELRSVLDSLSELDARTARDLLSEVDVRTAFEAISEQDLRTAVTISGE